MKKQTNGLESYRLEIKDTLKQLKTSIKSGLSQEEAERRLKEYGENVVIDKKPINKLKLLINQFYDPLVMILIFAVLISALTKEVTDAIVILLILVANAVLGFTQNYKAEKSIQALKEIASPESTVIREGNIVKIKSNLLVPGDILIVEAGTKVTADSRIIESHSLEVNESILT